MEKCDDSKTTKSWSGSSISDLCKGKAPWHFSVSPVNISQYHAVLYNLPVTLKAPPIPHCPSKPKHWDEDHVRMPYSGKNLFPVKENGADVIKLRWTLIKDALSRPIKNSRELEAAIMTYNSLSFPFGALHYFFEEVLSLDETEYFFDDLLPKIIKLALRLPEIVPGSFPLLQKNHNRSVSLSQLQIACLLANAFLCTFPWRKDVASLYPGVNFVRLFSSCSRPKYQNSLAEKLKCLIHYFRRVTSVPPVGVLTFERKFIPRRSMPRWDTLENNLGNTKIHIDSSGTIEDGLGFLQVDFANKNVGGGVLGYGCVQEEIRFVICPELIISRLFVEQLGDHEAVVVTGPERYSKYSGYGDTFKWDGNFQDDTPYDEYGRRRTLVCVIDATHFNKPVDQFYPSAILRELNKAYVGFNSREKDNLAPVATGNWGCGAFRGSATLKSLIQLMACSAAGRDIVYYSFGNVELQDELYNMYLFLANNRVTITQLWRFLCGFATLSLPQERLYAYIQQAFFDGKKQPTLKKFFGINMKKKENETPSTSKESKKTDNDKKIAQESSDIMEYSDDDDVIPATPPANEFVYENERFQIKTKISNEDIIKKLPKSDIAELIDIIDGNANRPKEKYHQDDSLLEMDKLRKSNISNETETTRILKEESEKMDISESGINETIVLNSPTTETKSTKRKITDYFQLKSSKSS